MGRFLFPLKNCHRNNYQLHFKLRKRLPYFSFRSSFPKSAKNYILAPLGVTFKLNLLPERLAFYLGLTSANPLFKVNAQEDHIYTKLARYRLVKYS